MNTKVFNGGILPSSLRQNVKKWYDSHREVYKKFLRLFKVTIQAHTTSHRNQ